ncbi:MAG: hypothetical protein IJT11_07740 [Bacteroidaceae bacterium]|nr:hypothetical protein [Bacteroidaceae bacterium]
MKRMFAMMAAVALVLGMTGCSNSDNVTVEDPTRPTVQEMERSLVGLWYEEFAYEDVTEAGKPFNRALIAVEAKDDHTGYVALAVFDDQFNEPLEIYGGPKDAPFTWQVTAEGHVILTDPSTGETYNAAPTRSGDPGDFVDIGQIDMNCGQGSIAFSNGSHEGTLTKAAGGKDDLLKDWMAKSTLPRACITDSIPVLFFSNLMNYVFEYPSVDPWGNPCTLSGVISVNKSLLEKDKPFNGIMLYNHFTIYETTQTPSRGAVEFPTGAAGLTDFIVVAPDYYGFGITEKEPQAYCISRANGRASLDAYLAAKRLIEDLEVKKGDDFIIVGYSEGGQTAMGVLREISERHPEVEVKRAFVGDGPYDINSMYDAIATGDTEMPSTVCNVLWAYNHFFHLGYDIHDYLKDPVASNFDEWFLSKKYKRKALDEELIKTKKTSDLCTAAVLDNKSALSQRFKAAFSEDALTSGWTPRSDLDVMLFHDTKDDVVPVENFYAMSQFLRQHHIKTEEFVGDYSGSAKEDLSTTNHEASALTFFAEILKWMRANY